MKKWRLLKWSIFLTSASNGVFFKSLSSWCRLLGSAACPLKCFQSICPRSQTGACVNMYLYPQQSLHTLIWCQSFWFLLFFCQSGELASRVGAVICSSSVFVGHCSQLIWTIPTWESCLEGEPSSGSPSLWLRAWKGISGLWRSPPPPLLFLPTGVVEMENEEVQ